jgi:hypothetical protein
MRFLMDGRLEACEDANARCEALARRTQSDEGGQLAVAQLWAVRQEQGRLAELEGIVRALAESHPEIAVWRLWLCRTLLETPRTAEAEALFRRLAANRFAELPRNSVWLSSAIVIADLCVGLGEDREAGWLYDELAPSAALFAIDEWASVNYGSVARALAQLAALLGDEAARPTSAGARADADRRGACLARTQLGYAEPSAASPPRPTVRGRRPACRRGGTRRAAGLSSTTDAPAARPRHRCRPRHSAWPAGGPSRPAATARSPRGRVLDGRSAVTVRVRDSKDVVAGGPAPPRGRDPLADLVRSVDGDPRPQGDPADAASVAQAGLRSTLVP